VDVKALSMQYVGGAHPFWSGRQMVTTVIARRFAGRTCKIRSKEFTIATVSV